MGSEAAVSRGEGTDVGASMLNRGGRQIFGSAGRQTVVRQVCLGDRGRAASVLLGDGGVWWVDLASGTWEEIVCVERLCGTEHAGERKEQRRRVEPGREGESGVEGMGFRTAGPIWEGEVESGGQSGEDHGKVAAIAMVECDGGHDAHDLSKAEVIKKIAVATGWDDGSLAILTPRSTQCKAHVSTPGCDNMRFQHVMDMGKINEEEQQDLGWEVLLHWKGHGLRIIHLWCTEAREGYLYPHVKSALQTSRLRLGGSTDDGSHDSVLVSVGADGVLAWWRLHLHWGRACEMQQNITTTVTPEGKGTTGRVLAEGIHCNCPSVELKMACQTGVPGAFISSFVIDEMAHLWRPCCSDHVFPMSVPEGTRPGSGMWLDSKVGRQEGTGTELLEEDAEVGGEFYVRARSGGNGDIVEDGEEVRAGASMGTGSHSPEVKKMMKTEYMCHWESIMFCGDSKGNLYAFQGGQGLEISRGEGRQPRVCKGKGKMSPLRVKGAVSPCVVLRHQHAKDQVGSFTGEVAPYNTIVGCTKE
ncbi:unnamed protein product [Choristocarpus tenellus]